MVKANVKIKWTWIKGPRDKNAAHPSIILSLATCCFARF